MKLQEVVPLDTALEDGESHTVEFKKSLSLLTEAAQTVVAYANTNGGSLFFGVTDDGQMIGISIGKNTIEKLGADLDSHIYPYSPAAIDPVRHTNGKEGIRLAVWPDRPPMVGMYLYSSERLDQSQPTSLASLQGYRRVGKSNRKTPDVMLLRQHLATDPLILAGLTGRTLGPGRARLSKLGFTVWMPRSSGGAALDISGYVVPGAPEGLRLARDFPGSDGTNRVSREIDIAPAEPGDEMFLVVNYLDQIGFLWETRLQITVSDDVSPKAGSLTRRIVVLPPSSHMP